MADGDLTRLIVTYTYICFSKTSTKRRPFGFDGFGMLPYRYLMYPTASVPDFTPDYYPCAVPRLVSCYALFE